MVRMPKIYWFMHETIDACYAEKQRGCAAMTNIVHIS